MATYQGPKFRFIDEISWQDLEAQGGFKARDRPLLVKGAVNRWPASERWTFEKLAELKRRDGSEVVTSFQNGLVEQGVTREPVIQPVAPYLHELAEAARKVRAESIDDIGLLPNRRRRTLAAGEPFHLDWNYLKTFTADRVYLAQWYILNEFPELRQDFAIRSLWPGLRRTWEYTFIGPAHTVTGLHYDFPNNWFCQVSGVKEFMLFPPEQAPHLCKSKKYDWGATLSDINISRLDEQPEESAAFARAEGLYARVETGDALFVPSKTWHAVVSLMPSVSLAVFGLTPWEIVAGGLSAQTRAMLHWLHLYRWGNCTCHRMDSAPERARAAA
ncbi:MAG: hypothetical protein NVS9B10_25470 [Nevskia sp.]